MDQKGSIVLPDKLRFDFTHNGAINIDDLGKIESISSQQLQENLPVYAKEVSLAQAKQIEGETGMPTCTCIFAARSIQDCRGR